MTRIPNSMYLVLPVPFRLLDGRLQVESQAGNGLDRWADHFDRVVVAAPLVPDALLEHMPGVVWRDATSLQHGDRIVCEPLPWAYTPGTFFRELRTVRQRMRAAIAGNQYLQFAIGGLLGDWAAIAALEAMRQHRAYAIHTDRVEHELMRKTATSAPLLRRMKIAVEAPWMKRYHRYVIRHAALGLWHGQDCFSAYAPWCAHNHLIHDVHTKASDLITEDGLAGKMEDILQAESLHLCYAGRLDPMKAPLEWLRAIAAARSQGAKLTATWYGEGALREQALAECLRLHLEDIVRLPGFIASRGELLAHVRAAHALVFTHITPESPRNLLEALVSGTPILGYDNAFAIDLLTGHGGGQLVPLHDTNALGSLIAALAEDRPRLVTMTEEAARNGRRFTDTAVFAARSELLKKFL